MTTSFEGYFQAYAEAFNRFDGERIAYFLNCPCLLVSGAAAHWLTTPETIQANTEALLAFHRAQGFGRATTSNVIVRPMGANLALAEVQWTVERADGTVLWTFRNTYNLADFGGGWKILASTTHGEAE
jgi:hypothetical protein